MNLDMEVDEFSIAEVIEEEVEIDECSDQYPRYLERMYLRKLPLQRKLEKLSINS